MSLFGFMMAGLPAGTALVAAGAGIAALTALYLLKLQRRRALVPFVPLWVAVLGERRSERLARRLRRLVSLLLQIAFLLLLIVAALDPRPVAADRSGRTVLLMVDRSASMSATDEAGGRLAVARRLGRDIIARLGRADRAMIASFSAGVASETGFEADAGLLAAAIDRLEPTDEPANLPRALAFAAAALRDRPHPTLVLIGDGAYSEDERALVPAELAGVDLRWAAVGRRGHNLAITGFAARRVPADRSSVEVGITIQSFRSLPSEAVLEIAAAGVPVDRRALVLAPGERQHFVLSDVAAPDVHLEARLLPRGPREGSLDDLAADDRAFAVVPGLGRRRVLLAGSGHLFLDGALLSLGDSLSVRRVKASDVESTRGEWSAYDAVIFDGVAPSPPPPQGRFIYLDPRGPGSPFAARGLLRDPVVSDASRLHPLLRHLSLADLNVKEARRLVLAEGDSAVASSFGAPLIITRSRPGLRVAALAFDPMRSDMPMRTAFPLFVANALDWLAGGEERHSAALKTGRPLRVPVDPGTRSARVIDPSGATTVLPALAGAVEIPVPRTGVWRVMPANGPEAVFAANLADPVESNTRPPRALVIAGRTLAAPDPGPGGPRRDIWAMALVAAAVLSLLEWWSYHRRWTV